MFRVYFRLLDFFSVGLCLVVSLFYEGGVGVEVFNGFFFVFSISLEEVVVIEWVGRRLGRW